MLSEWLVICQCSVNTPKVHHDKSVFLKWQIEIWAGKKTRNPQNEQTNKESWMRLCFVYLESFVLMSTAPFKQYA